MALMPCGKELEMGKGWGQKRPGREREGRKILKLQGMRNKEDPVQEGAPNKRTSRHKKWGSSLQSWSILTFRSVVPRGQDNRNR